MQATSSSRISQILPTILPSNSFLDSFSESFSNLFTDQANKLLSSTSFKKAKMKPLCHNCKL